MSELDSDSVFFPYNFCFSLQLFIFFPYNCSWTLCFSLQLFLDSLFFLTIVLGPLFFLTIILGLFIFPYNCSWTRTLCSAAIAKHFKMGRTE